MKHQMLKTYWRLLAFARPLSRYTVPYFFYSVLHAVFNTFTYTMIMPIVSSLFSDGFQFVPTHHMPPIRLSGECLNEVICYAYTAVFGERFSITYLLLLLSVILIAANLLSNLFRYAGAMTVETMRMRTLQKMRNEMFAHTMAMNVGYFSDQRKGDIMSKITSDVMMVQFCITNTLQVLFREPFLIIGYIVMMLKISWELTLFSILYLPLVALVIGAVVKRLRHPAREGQERMGDMVTIMEESLSAVKIVKGYNAFDYVRRKFSVVNARMSDLLLSMARKQQLASPMSEFLGITAISVVLIFGGMLVMRGSLTASWFVAYIAAFSQITRPLRSIIDQFANINQGLAAGERIFSILDARSQIEDKPDARTLDLFRDSIEFRHVSFAYTSSHEVLHDISFTVRKGDKIAFVGENELAQTALFKILMGELEPDEGSVKWGQTVTTSYLPKDNTAYFEGCTDSLVDWIRQYSAKKDDVYLRGFLGRMLFSGEEVFKPVNVLSGGEKVRCMLSRMMLSGANVLLLDQPTNHLDMEAIQAVNKGLCAFPGNILLASHDHELLQTTCNRVIEFQPDGTIIDRLCSYDDYVAWKLAKEA